MLHAYSSKKHTSKWRFKQIRLSACLVLMVERIGWKPSSHAPYKNPALKTLSPSILQHLFLRVQSPNFTVYCDFCLHYLRAVICWWLKRNIPFFFLVFFNLRLWRVGHGNYFLESWFSWWIELYLTLQE